MTNNHTLTFARDILARGPKLAVSYYLNADQRDEWTRAAQMAVDGDTSDLEWLEEQQAADEREQPEFTRAERNSIGSAAALEWETRGWEL